MREEGIAAKAQYGAWFQKEVEGCILTLGAALGS